MEKSREKLKKLLRWNLPPSLGCPGGRIELWGGVCDVQGVLYQMWMRRADKMCHVTGMQVLSVMGTHHPRELG